MILKPEVRIAARLQKYPEVSRAWHAWKNEADPEKKDKIRVVMIRRFGEPFVSGQKLRAGFTRRGRGVARPVPVPSCYPSARGAKATRCLEEAEARLAWGCNYVLPESEMVAADDAKVSRVGDDLALLEMRLAGLSGRGVSFDQVIGPELDYESGSTIKLMSSNQLVKVADGAYVVIVSDEPVHPEFEKAYDEFVQEMTALGMESANKPVVVESEPVGPVATDFSGAEPQATVAYSVSEAAEVLGISPSSVRSRLAAGSLKGEKDQAGKWTVFGPLA